VWTAEGRQRDEWGRWSLLIAQVLNGPCTRKDKREWRANDFDPFAQQKEPAMVTLTGTEFIDFLGGFR